MNTLCKSWRCDGFDGCVWGGGRYKNIVMMSLMSPAYGAKDDADGNDDVSSSRLHMPRAVGAIDDMRLHFQQHLLVFSFSLSLRVPASLGEGMLSLPALTFSQIVAAVTKNASSTPVALLADAST